MGITDQMGDINDGGGYDLSELQSARESLDNDPNALKDVPKDVQPEYIQVSDEEVAETKEMGSREVFIDYDKYGNVVGVELL